jgi:subtilase family serine protease
MDGLGVGRPLGPPPVATAVAPLPDLTVTSVSLSPNTLSGGAPLTFTAVITNAAAGAASNVGVRFLVDGVPLGADQSIAQLAGGASLTLTAQWSAKGQNGPHTLEVAVDPANTIPELDETNNSATKTFTVQGGKAQ